MIVKPRVSLSCSSHREATEIRERFTSVNTACTLATVSAGFVVKANGAPEVQIRMDRGDDDSYPTVIVAV